MRWLSLMLSVGLLFGSGCAGQQSQEPQGQIKNTVQRQLAANEADVYIEGLACPFCTYNVEKKIREIPTVESVKTDLNTGVAHVVFRPGVVPDVKALRAKVKQSGFTVKKIVTNKEGHYENQ